MSIKKLLIASILSAILVVGAIAAIGSIATNPIFAQIRNDDSSQSTTSATTTAASSNATKLSGVIASLQNNEAGAPAWITAGHWALESDRSIFDNATEPRISNFSAVIYMTSITNGTNLHQHNITDFRQTSILHSSGNITTINGTMTISMSDGPHQNTSGIIELQNNMISIWVNPTGLDEHFGPTPIYRLVLPDRLKMDDDDTAGTTTQGNLGDDDADDRQAGGGTTTQGTSGDDETVCTGTISSGTLDNVIVPSGDCALTGTVVVNGNVKQTGGNLIIDGRPIAGNVQAEGGGFTEVVNGATIEGDVQIKKTSGPALVRGSDIDGNVQVEEKSSGSIGIVANDVNGDVQVWKNSGGEIILIENNDIGGNLQCKENTPNPTVSGNSASDIECSD